MKADIIKKQTQRTKRKLIYIIDLKIKNLKKANTSKMADSKWQQSSKNC